MSGCFCWMKKKPQFIRLLTSTTDETYFCNFYRKNKGIPLFCMALPFICSVTNSLLIFFSKINKNIKKAQRICEIKYFASALSHKHVW